MAVYKQPGSKNWWFKFTWRGETLRESTRQTNKRVAEQMEAARKTGLAKGEVGIKERTPAPTIRRFAEQDFTPYVRATFAEKLNTRSYYENGIKAILAFEKLAGATLDTATGEAIAAYVAKRQQDGLKTSSINRELQVLRRMFALASEWGRTDRALPRVRMVPGEAHRERVLSSEEEARYLAAATAVGDEIVAAYGRALVGIRATQRGETPIPPEDPYRLRDVATLLLDTGMRPEECLRLRWEYIRDDAVHVPFGKTANARRVIPLSQRSLAIIGMRRDVTSSVWVFPAPTRSGHIEKSSLKKAHHKACSDAGIEFVPLYTFRHSCLTRWAASGMDPWTIAYLAGHRDMSTTRRYIHPQLRAVRAALERARNQGEATSKASPEGQGGHSPGHSGDAAAPGQVTDSPVIN